MSSLSCLLAQVQMEDVVAPWRSVNPSALGGLIVLGAIGLVTLLALAWAVFLRKRGRRRRSQHHAHRHSSAPAESLKTPNGEAPTASRQERRKWRRSRRRHRSRNPTLAQTGGLPPIRSEGPPEPQA